MTKFKQWQRFQLVTLMTIFVFQFGLGQEERASTCEPITAPMCKNVTPYNFTMFPNTLHHRSQGEAAMEMHQFYPVFKTGCSRNLAPFMCTAYFPPCMSSPGLLVLPCRSLCEEARKGCQSLMSTFGLPWPQQLQCERFSDNQPCISGLEENAAATTFTTHDTNSRPKLVHSSPGAPAWTAAPPSSTPPSVSVGPSGISGSSLASVAVAERLQSSLLDWLVTGTALNKAQTELAAEQVLVAKLNRKKLALEYARLKRQSGGSGARSGMKKRRNRRKINL